MYGRIDLFSRRHRRPEIVSVVMRLTLCVDPKTKKSRENRRALSFRSVKPRGQTQV